MHPHSQLHQPPNSERKTSLTGVLIACNRFRLYPTQGPVKKLPDVTPLFWGMKICATILGVTASGLLAQLLHLGYGTSLLILLVAFRVVLVAQLAFKRYIPALYWAVVLTSSTTGTNLAEYLQRTLGLGYATAALLGLLAVQIGVSRWRVNKSLPVNELPTRVGQLFFWGATLSANALGAYAGLVLAGKLSFGGSTLLVCGLLAALAAAGYYTSFSRVLLFWAAFALTRPLGSAVEGLFTGTAGTGGLGIGSEAFSLGLLALMAGLVVYVSLYPRPEAVLATGTAVDAKEPAVRA